MPESKVAINSVCVFLASSPGNDPDIRDTTVELGKLLAAEGIDLVYGGGGVGLMGVLADAALAAGGRVTGVIPTSVFSRDVGHTGCTELIEVASMHERKVLMYERSDAFVALPGGYGTLEELAEILTWSQIGLHQKPIGVLNVNDYWTPLLRWFDQAVGTELLRASNRALVVEANSPPEMLNALRAHAPVREEKWISLDET